MKKEKKYSKDFWKRLAAEFSGEEPETTGYAEQFREADLSNTEKYWKELGTMDDNRNYDVERAWNNVKSRIEENGLLQEASPPVKTGSRRLYFRIAAAVVVLIGLGAILLTTLLTGNHENLVTVASGNDQKNIVASLPEGSIVWLNRDSKITYSKNLGSKERKISLEGEAFFEITPDPGKPFIIDAGKGKITVIGTSFNVISNNEKKEVEVYVKTGKVLLSDASGDKSVILEPEFIGTMDGNSPSVKINTDQNYLAWKTDLLVFKNEKLSVVFNDLKKVYNINIIADDQEILKRPLTATYDKEPQDTIIDLICTTFTLSYRKDGNNYHLSKR